MTRLARSGRLSSAFYGRDTETVARELVGCVLRHDTPAGTASGIIVETEAYLGCEDEASHARFGRTDRSSIMFGPPGVAYVYFIYGMHYMFNAVTEQEDRAGAVLVRALEPLQGREIMMERRGVRKEALLTSGPARLTQALGIDGAQNGVPLTSGPLGIWEHEVRKPSRIVTTRRIGVIGSKDLHLRYLMKGSVHVSR